MRFCLLVLAILASSSSRAVEITNFKSGLACTHTSMTKDQVAWVCQPTIDVLLTDQGICVFNGIEKPCTWVGFEFDYSNAGKDQKLQCVSETSLPVDQGNPTKLIASGSKSESYEIELKSGSGHFFNPQYFVFTGRSAGDSVLISKGRCSESGRSVLEYVFNVHYPIVPND
jgi:hypothetical protein